MVQFFSTEPLFAVLNGYLLQGEVLDFAARVGGAFSLGGVLLEVLINSKAEYH